MTLPVAFSGQLVDDLHDPRAPCSWPSRSRHHSTMLRPGERARRPGTTKAMPDLAEALVGDADHRRPAGRPGCAQQEVLDLGRIGVEATDDEHVLGPTRRSAGSRPAVDHAEVAGAQPAVGGEGRRPWPRGRRGSADMTLPPRSRTSPGSPGRRRRRRRRRCAARTRGGAGPRWWRWSRRHPRARSPRPCPPRSARSR